MVLLYNVFTVLMDTEGVHVHCVVECQDIVSRVFYVTQVALKGNCVSIETLCFRVSGSRGQCVSMSTLCYRGRVGQKDIVSQCVHYVTVSESKAHCVSVSILC